MLSGGLNYVSSPPAFSNDGSRLLVCSGNSVSIFSTSTGLKVSSLEGHTGVVTAVIVVPAKSKVICNCWTASLDGTIRYWDFSAPELIKTINVKFPIFSMVIPSLLRGETDEKQGKLFAYLSIENTGVPESKFDPGLRGRIKKCNLTTSRVVGGLNLAETKKPEVLTVSPSGDFVGITNKRKLRIWKIPAADTENAFIKKLILHHTKTVTVLAFHPTQRIVAAGDVTGRILIWRMFGNKAFNKGDKLARGRSMDVDVDDDDEERPGVRGVDDADSCTSWHWHPFEVKVLRFSSDGAYLYSGGKEGVLVVWQLDSGKKKFLPRIGSPLLYFIDSPDPSLSSISCADNQIHLLKMPSMKIWKSISGIKLPFLCPEKSKGSYNGIAFDQNAGLVALCTENYCIQLYSLFDDRGISEVQVCERNHQPGDEVTIVITQVVISPDGSMMSTAEEKLAEDGLGGLVSLKFWTSGSQQQGFSLSTIVYEPHRDAGISAVAFHPTSRMAVSSSHGGDFKVWVCNNGNEQKDKALPNSGWTCHAIGSYKKKPMTAAAFSSDGSVLAVAAETVITLWDPIKNVLVAIIGETLAPIVTLSFVGKSDYLISASWGTHSQLSIWSTSKLSMTWSYRIFVEAVASAADSSYIAALALLPDLSKRSESNYETFKGRDGIILVFNAADPLPVATWSVKKAKGGSLAFVQVDQSLIEENSLNEKPSQVLAYINGDHEYVLFDPHGKEFSITRQDAIIEESGQFGYASIYGQLPEFAKKRSQASRAPTAPSERPWETIFSGSSHNLPPLSKLCSVFLESLLEKRTAAVD